MRPFKLPFVLFILALISFSDKAEAQPYQTSLGIRGPLGNGVTLKHFIGSSSALEGIAAFRYRRGGLFTVLYEEHAPAFDVDGLYWYFGGGGHIGFWDGDDADPWFDPGGHAAVGIDGVVGIEYTIEPIPINVGIDIKPSFDLLGRPEDPFWPGGGGIAIRYTF